MDTFIALPSAVRRRPQASTRIGNRILYPP